jgi:hypothetical protein
MICRYLMHKSYLSSRHLMIFEQIRISVVGSGAEHDAWLRWLRYEGKRPVLEYVQGFLDDLSKQANTAQKVDTVSRFLQSSMGCIICTPSQSCCCTASLLHGVFTLG